MANGLLEPLDGLRVFTEPGVKQRQVPSTISPRVFTPRLLRFWQSSVDKPSKDTWLSPFGERRPQLPGVLVAGRATEDLQPLFKYLCSSFSN